jgi:hypothetical protein
MLTERELDPDLRANGGAGGCQLASAGADGTVKIREAPGLDPKPGGVAAPKK